MHGHRRMLTVASLVVLTALVLPVIAPGLDAAPTTATSGGAPQEWAYGAQHWSNTSVQFLDGTYTSKAYFGWQVVITETNTSATTQEIEGVRTIGVSYFAEYCRPNCTSPNATANLTLRAHEQQTAFVNLTDNATVYERTSGFGGTSTAVSALGISDASVSSLGALDESYSIARGSHAGASGTLNVTESAQMAVVFTPALGIAPWNVSKGDSWNSTSAFSASGGWTTTYAHSDSLQGVSGSQSGNASGQLNRSGSESVNGRDLGNLTLANGANVTVVVVGYLGPFAFGDGLFVTSGASDLFASSTAAYAPYEFALGQATLSAMDLSIARGHHHVVFAAASASVGVGSTTLGATSVATGTGVASGGQSPPGSDETVQAQPESPQYAQAQSNCLVNGCGGGATSTTGVGSYIGLFVVAAVIVVFAVGVAVALVRRPRRPAPAPGGAGPN